MADLIGYAAEMRRIEKDIVDIGGAESLAAPIDPPRVTQYVYLLYQRASLGGDPAHLSAVGLAINRAIPLLRNPDDLYLLKANVAFKLHNLAEVRSAVLGLRSVCGSPEGRLIRADLDFQDGHLAKARDQYLAALERDRSWSALARLAYFHGKTGDPTGADQLYAAAEEELTAKEMRSFAWLEVQRGYLAFAQGCYSRARVHYKRAAAAYPGYWFVDEHIAELLGADGEYREAAAILERILSIADRADLRQAIGELYELAAEPAKARHCYNSALTGYLQSAEKGELHYYHHLADYYSNVAKDGEQAVRWARADVQLRQNFSTQSALAWAFHQNGQPGEACEWIERALASGAVDAHLCSRAAKIYSSAGNIAQARTYAERARQLNPSVGKFHFHH
jgi:tetratricopeptide (TPR) repeat protein